MSIKVKLDEGAFMPQRAHATDAGADIMTPEDFTVEPWGSRIIRTGIHIETPPNCVTLVKSKSGLYIKHDITTTGVIDEGFTGEIIIKIINNGPSFKKFKRGDKVAQIVVMPVFYPEFIRVDEINGGDRGDNGYGSTGR